MYETFDHTADVGLRAIANNLPDLFSEGARALFAAMVEDPTVIRPVQEVRVCIEAANLEELWHDWLAELLFLFHTRRMAFGEFDVGISPNDVGDGNDARPAASDPNQKEIRLNAVIRGEPIDPNRHQIVAEVKAVTWHALRVEQVPEGWLGEFIIDI